MTQRITIVPSYDGRPITKTFPNSKLGTERAREFWEANVNTSFTAFAVWHKTFGVEYWTSTRVNLALAEQRR